MTTLAVNDVSAMRVRLFVPWVGAWLADVDLDIGSDKPMPKGRVSLTVNGTKLVGTVDPRASGRFGEKGALRVVAGGAGWDRILPEQTFHNDAGLMSKDVITSTAAACGESAVDGAPVELAVDWIRSRGPAVRVLKDRAWYVDEAGVTQVAERPSKTMPTDYELLSWDPYQRSAELAGESILWPGTVLEDTRIGDAPHRAVVRDVEHVFDAAGARITALCTLGKKPTPDSSRLVGVLTAAIRELGGLDHLKTYRYRIAKQGVDGRLVLQATRKVAGVPDTLPVSIFPGMAGDSAQHTPGTECVVIFTEGDPSRPLVVGFDGKDPIIRRVHASTLLELGDDSATPLAHSTPLGLILAAFVTEMTADVALLTNPPTSTTFSIYAPAKLALLNALLGVIAAQLAAIPTTKVTGT